MKIPNMQKKIDNLTGFFTLLGSAPVKAACWWKWHLLYSKRWNRLERLFWIMFIKKSKKCEELWNEKVLIIVDIILSYKGQNMGT